MDQGLVIVGAGGHGRVVAEVAAAAGRRVLGFVDAAITVGTPVNGLPVLAAEVDGLLADHPPASTQVFVAIGDNLRRSQVAAHATTLGYAAPILVHPQAVVSPTATLAHGTVVMAGVVINANASVGALCIVNTGATLDHDNELADGVQICPGVHAAGAVRFGRGAFVGTGASIVPGVRIGVDARVGAGAVVTRDVADRTTVVGNPARPVGEA
jgi:sugar O-acyltransferase (sialic acid O-acetyltransferase NeuD family)